MTIITNPSSRRGRGKKLAETVAKVLEEKGIAYTVKFTSHNGHATQLAREAAQSGETLVLCIGGDGTVSEVAGGLAGSATVLGIIPAGTGDDFARYIGIPKAPLEALGIALSDSIRHIDLGTANGRVFINAAGSGFDVAALQHTLGYKKYVHGLLAYVLGVLRAVFGYPPMAVTITHDGGEIRQKALLLTIANGQYIGGGMHAVPMADASDGLFDVQYVDEIPRWKIPFLLAAFVKGKHVTWPIVHRVQCSGLTVTTSDSSLQLDGEILEEQTVHYRIMPGALKIKAPSSYRQQDRVHSV